MPRARKEKGDLPTASKKATVHTGGKKKWERHG